MAEESFWKSAGKRALKIATLGATGKIDAIREESEQAETAYRAAYERLMGLERRVQSLVESRGKANKTAHSVLERIIDLLTSLGMAREYVKDRDASSGFPSVAKMRSTVVSFNLALELVTASGAGIIGSVGAWAAVSALGVASTGTAIAGLSGAAATNATLAWFGGGSLATGGGGMVLGSVVLGGLLAVPLVGVAAWLGHRAADAKVAQIRPEIETMRNATEELHRSADEVERECQRVESIVKTTDALSQQAQVTLDAISSCLRQLEKIGTDLADTMNTRGFDFKLKESA